jgi:hypothetical protein
LQNPVGANHRFDAQALKYAETLSQKMRENIDKPKYKKLYSRRMQIIEPCFSDIEYRKGMDRFTLRGKKKVDIQWKLYCVVHNREMRGGNAEKTRETGGIGA